MKNRKSRLQKGGCMLLSGLLLMPSTAYAQAPETGGAQKEAADTSGQTVYRLYNLSTGEHLYTHSSRERAQCVRLGWMDEGIGWIGAQQGDPVYRLYNPNARGGDHYYTMNRKEAEFLTSVGWK